MFNKKKRVLFVTIGFANVPGVFDYPKDLPIPAIGCEVQFNGKFGRVSNVKHMTCDTVTDIKIICDKL